MDRIHRLLHEWSVGPDNSFPVQLALLTKAQWRVAANLPRLMNDASKLIEQHLAEYRRQTAAMTDDFAGMVDIKHGELKNIVLKSRGNRETRMHYSSAIGWLMRMTVARSIRITL